MKKIKQFFKLFLSLYLFSSASIFADVKIVSPAVEVSKIWANKQVLVINATEGEDVFYSFSGEDPLKSGFVYDEPVLIDITGDVELKISSVNKNHQRKDIVLNYTVDESLNDKITTLEEKSFINKLNESVIYNLECGQHLDIPETFNYVVSCVTEDYSMEKGRSIYVNSDSTLDRYASLVLKSSSNCFWNYVIHVIPVVKGEYTKAAVPFEIIEWSKIKFNDNKFIYAIDDSWWQRSGQIIEIDRSVPHIIKWQPVDYDPFNPIVSYNIPATPVIKCELMENSTIELSLEGDSSYRFAKNKNAVVSAPAVGLHEKIVVDAFPGENFSTLLPLDVYSENVYQGQLFAFVQLNRKKPAIPEIVLSDISDVCRNDVSLYMKAAKEEDIIKYYIHGPVTLNFEQLTHKSPIEPALKVDSQAFVNYENTEIKLVGKEDVPVYYKVYAYSVDKWDNVSFLKTVDVVIDKCNYFINPKSSVDNPDGTYEKPFNDLSKLEEIINNNNWSNFYLYGKISVNELNLNLKQNFQITGVDKAQVEFGKNSGLFINGGSCSLNNILLKNTDLLTGSDSIMINVINGTLQLKDCELSFTRNKNAVLINSIQSIVNIANTGLNSVANDYSCVISGINSKITLNKCRVSTVATTNVNITVKNSKLNLLNSSCSLSGLNSRIVELFSSEGVLSMNNFTAKKNGQNSSSDIVWKDENSKVTESKNKVVGF